MAPATYVYRVHDAASNSYLPGVYRAFQPASDDAQRLNKGEQVLGGCGYRFAAVNTTIQHTELDQYARA